MALAPGTRPGVHEVPDLIGTGGRGEVYEAGLAMEFRGRRAP
jgi:hypothetical protein